jgi:hypothetical protein
MKRFLRASAILAAAGSLALWLATGAHRGWTKTSVAVEKTDEVTGLTYADYEKRFVAGVEILAAGLAVASALGVASCFLGRRPAKPVNATIH